MIISSNHFLRVIVSLPREWFQEINPMMIVHTTHGLFLTYTQESYLYLHNIQLINIHTMYIHAIIINPFLHPTQKDL